MPNGLDRIFGGLWLQPKTDKSWLNLRRKQDLFHELKRLKKTSKDSLSLFKHKVCGRSQWPPKGKWPILKGFEGGIMEIVLRHRGDAFRVVYAVQIGEEIWVLHALQKKSTQGIKTPKHEIDWVHERLKRLKEALK